MLQRMKAWLDRAGSGEAATVETTGTELQGAAAALLVEAATLDGRFEQAEAEVIEGVLTSYFDLSAGEVREIIDAAEREVEHSTDLFGFTRVIKEHMEPEDRGQIMEMLWEVAYADGVVHDYEANLARRVAGLLHVPDRVSGEARKRVLAKRGVAKHEVDGDQT